MDIIKRFSCLLLYFAAYIPLFSVAKEYRVLTLISIVIFFAYSISLLLEKQEKFQNSLIFLVFSVSLISFLSQNASFLVPLGFLPFILHKADFNINVSFLKLLSVLILVCISVCFLANNHGNTLSSSLNDSIPYVFSLLFVLFYLLAFNEENIELPAKINNDSEIERKNIEINILREELKEAQQGLNDNSYLAVILGLDFDSFDVNANIEKILTTIKDSTKAIYTAYYSYNEKNSCFFLQKHFGESDIMSKKPVPAGIGIVGSVYDKKQYSYIKNLQKQEENDFKRNLLNGVDNLLAVPILVKGNVVAVISIGLGTLSKKKELDIVNLCCIIANKASTEFEKLIQHEEVEKKSITDKLTNLYNRQFFDVKIQEELNNAMVETKQIAFVEIDLDYFKQMNDTHGHEFGDEVLKTAAKTFSENIRASDYAFRLGGDEFALLLLGVDKKKAYKIVKNIVSEYDKKVTTMGFIAKKDGEDVRSSFSIGISTYPHEKVKNVKDLIKLADEAVYYVKNHGKNNIAIAK